MRRLAEKAGVGVTTIYMTEAGKTVPRLSIIGKLVNVLEIDEFRAAIECGSK